MNTFLSHVHVTLTLPGRLRNLIFERSFPAHELVTVAAYTLRGHIRDTAGLEGHDWTNGMIGAAHACGNSLNYNPHVHIVTTRELVNLRTGEIIDQEYIPYAAARVKWMKAVLKMLVRKNYLAQEEADGFLRQYPGGFHVHFKPILGNENDVLFKTAEYLAAGYFHNSRILEVNHSKKTISFKFRRLIDPHTKEKLFAIQTMPLYEFMARMLFYLPDHHRKTIRYYGIYAQGIEKSLELIRKKTWAYSIEHCFMKEPNICPQCGTFMVEKVIYAFEAERIAKKLTMTHYLYQGYFIPRHGP